MNYISLCQENIVFIWSLRGCVLNSSFSLGFTWSFWLIFIAQESFFVLYPVLFAFAFMSWIFCVRVAWAFLSWRNMLSRVRSSEFNRWIVVMAPCISAWASALSCAAVASSPSAHCSTLSARADRSINLPFSSATSVSSFSTIYISAGTRESSGFAAGAGAGTSTLIFSGGGWNPTIPIEKSSSCCLCAAACRIPLFLSASISFCAWASCIADCSIANA
mmetsp:Transcript_5623/g.7600  ORF Transcript_5623/g.7600 Transcript_5623/m.7600 type:complete len:219 (+) Transcript_5623:135-791(+)